MNVPKEFDECSFRFFVREERYSFVRSIVCFRNGVELENTANDKCNKFFNLFYRQIRQKLKVDVKVEGRFEIQHLALYFTC